MRSFKKGLALTCALVMLLQLVFAVPVSAEAPALSAESYDVVFLSDLHNGVGGYNGLKQMMSELKAEGRIPACFPTAATTSRTTWAASPTGRPRSTT